MFEDLRARFWFWYSKKFIKHNKHYEFMFNMSNADAFAVRLIKKFPGVIIEYSNLHMSTDKDLSFDFNVIANPNLCDVESKAFKNFTVHVIRNMLNEAVNNAIKEPNENRNTDSVKSDTERTLHEESVAVSEERVSNRKPRKKTVRRNKAVHSEVQQSAADSGSRNQS